MGFSCGLVGLPNAGKSTLFNALTQTGAALAANYPFSTLDPNIGEAALADERLDALAQAANSAAIIPTRLRFVDIAGLVRGAAQGEGLGNAFLGHIRAVEAIVHVVRAFEDENITHAHGRVDAKDDAETIETELMLADLESLERREHGLTQKAKKGDKEARELMSRLVPIRDALRDGIPARQAGVDATGLELLTAKPLLYVCNTDEASVASGNAHTKAIEALASSVGAPALRICAKIEEEIVALPQSERAAYFSAAGIDTPGLDRIVAAGYRLLNLITFFTAGEKEARAWTLPEGATAREAAGRIHTDFARGFIRAEVISCADFLAHKGEAGAREAGKMRLEGRDYIVQDGDVMHMRFAV